MSDLRLIIAHPDLDVMGGIEKVVLKIAQHYDAPIYCSRYVPEKTFPEFRDLDVRILKVMRLKPIFKIFPPAIGNRGIAGIQYYAKKIREKYDIINAHGIPSEWIANKNKNVIWYCHGLPKSMFELEAKIWKRNTFERLMHWNAANIYKKIEFGTVKKISKVLCNSTTTQYRIKNYLNHDAEVLYLGIDTKEFNSKGYQKYFFYPSRIVPRKRFEFAIKAFKLFKKRNPEYKNWKLIIAGGVAKKQKEYVEYYKNIKKLLGDDGEILTDISFDDIKKLYSNCYAVLFSPIDEPFGLIPLEAKACKKPIIAINEGGCRETIRDNIDGYLINNIEEMADKIRFLVENPYMVKKMGKEGYKDVRKRFSWDQFFKNMDKIYRKVIEE